MSEWIEIRERLYNAFSGAPRPDLNTISIIGCCERHEPDFDWYRRHTWQEFEQAIETKGFDPADFVAIHPLAFHYFTPGVLRAAIKRLATDAEKYWDDDLWIQHYIIGQYRLDEFKKQYLPLYEIDQRQAIVDTLRWYQQWFLAQNGYDYDYDEPDDNDDSEESRGTISEAIMLVWQSET